MTPIRAFQSAAPQESGKAAPQDVETLHVYTNLLQIPVLVLDPFRHAVKPIPAEKFTVQVDDAKPFHPSSVRLEGEDPITLAVLVDGSRRNSLMPEFASALASLSPKILQPRDRVAIYGMDGCHLLRFGEMLPAQSMLLRVRAEGALNRRIYDQTVEGPCASEMSLWKSIAVVANALSHEPGRRIVLALTDGFDSSRTFHEDRARQIATGSGVAVFAIAERGKIPPGPAVTTSSLSSGGGRRGAGYNVQLQTVRGPSDLAVVSETSGGMVLETEAGDLAATLNQFVSLVRGRYIVEFDKPANLHGGNHLLTIGFGQPSYFIRTAGTSMPVADPVAPDPRVQHGVSDPNSIDQARIDPSPGPPQDPPHGSSQDPSAASAPSAGTAMPGNAPAPAPAAAAAAAPKPTPVK